MIPFLFWLVINVLVGYAIGKRKDSVGGSIILSILLGPIGWLLAALWPGDIRRCPFCAENTKREAKVCAHCGRDLPPVPVREARENKARTALAIVLALVAIGTLVWIVGTATGAFGIASQTARGLEEAKARNWQSPTPAPEKTESQPIETPIAADTSTPINIPVATATPIPRDLRSGSDPNSATLTKPVSIKIQYGIISIPAGTKLPVVLRSGDIVKVRYFDGADYEIPISSTDLSSQ